MGDLLRMAIHDHNNDDIIKIISSLKEEELNDVITGDHPLISAVKSDNFFAFDLLLNNGSDPHMLNGAPTTVYCDILNIITDNLILNPLNKYNNFDQFIELPLFYGNLTDSLNEGNPSVYEYIFGGGLRDQIEYGGLLTLTKEQLSSINIIEQKVKSSINNVENLSLMNTQQQLNLQKTYLQGSETSPLNFLDNDTMLELVEYLKEEAPYSTATSRFKPEQSYKSYENENENGKRTKKKKKKKKKRRKKKKWKKGKTQRGGLYVKIDENRLNNWNSIHTFKNDCIPCTLDFIGFGREYCSILCGFYGQMGTTHKEIIRELKNKYKGYSVSAKLLDGFKPYLDNLYNSLNQYRNDRIIRKVDNDDIDGYMLDLKKIFNTIPNNYIMLGRINIKNKNFGHAVVFGNINGVPVLYDPQHSKDYKGLDDITVFLVLHMVDYIHLYYVHKKGILLKDNQSGFKPSNYYHSEPTLDIESFNTASEGFQTASEGFQTASEGFHTAPRRFQSSPENFQSPPGRNYYSQYPQDLSQYPLYLQAWQ